MLKSYVPINFTVTDFGWGNLWTLIFVVIYDTFGFLHVVQTTIYGYVGEGSFHCYMWFWHTNVYHKSLYLELILKIFQRTVVKKCQQIEIFLSSTFKIFLCSFSIIELLRGSYYNYYNYLNIMKDLHSIEMTRLIILMSSNFKLSHVSKIINVNKSWPPFICISLN